MKGLVKKEIQEPFEDDMVPDCVNYYFTGVGPKLATAFTNNWSDNIIIRS